MVQKEEKKLGAKKNVIYSVVVLSLIGLAVLIGFKGIGWIFGMDDEYFEDSQGNTYWEQSDGTYKIKDATGRDMKGAVSTEELAELNTQKCTIENRNIFVKAWDWITGTSSEDEYNELKQKQEEAKRKKEAEYKENRDRIAATRYVAQDGSYYDNDGKHYSAEGEEFEDSISIEYLKSKLAQGLVTIVVVDSTSENTDE